MFLLGTGYSNRHNFKILTTTSKTKKADKYYVVFLFNFSYTKPAHYSASGSRSGNIENYRFNFNNYDTGVSTVNNKGHNIVNTTETVEMQINAANCGFTPVEENGNPSNATGYINLNKNYYSGLTVDPNGGTHDAKTNKYNYGIKVCESKVTIANPERKGYVFLGWTLTKGKNCTGATFDSETGEFTYCGASTSSTNLGNDNTCVLTAVWLKNDSTLVLPEAGGIDLSNILILSGLGCIIFAVFKIKNKGYR